MVDRFDPFRHILADHGSEVIDADAGTITCPGKHLHRKPNADSDCKVWLNEDGTILVSCYHHSCCDSRRDLNLALMRHARAGGSHPPIRAGNDDQDRQPAEAEAIRQEAEEALPEILRNWKWPVAQLSQDSPERLDDVPLKEHRKAFLAGLFDDAEIVWCGRDEKDTGSPNYRWRFRSVAEWLAEDAGEALFTCASTFKPGTHSRSNSNVETTKYLVVESDTLNHDDTAAIFRFLNSNAMRLRAVVDSGNKSLHGWFDYPDPNQMEVIKVGLPLLGGDGSMMKPSQPARLPGVIRPDTGRPQRLLYLDLTTPKTNSNKIPKINTMKDPELNGLGREFRAMRQHKRNAEHARQKTTNAAPKPDHVAPPVVNVRPPEIASNPERTDQAIQPPVAGDPKPHHSAWPGLEALPEVYYDGATKDYYRRNNTGGYVRVGIGTITTYLQSMGYTLTVPKGTRISDLDEVLLRIQSEHDLHYVAPLAGWKAGFYQMENSHVLVTSSPKPVVPVAGDWPLIKHVGENLFGALQWPYVLSWIKLSLMMFQTGIWQAGQAFVMCGPKGSGKNLFMQILLALFGGRAGDPYQYMTGATSFNHDMFGAELLVIEDKAESISIQARRAFGAHIKNITVNELQRHHQKYGDAHMLRPLWRIGVSLNDDHERLMVLPPLDRDIEDKIMLLKVFLHPMPMPTKTPALKKKFEDAWRAEIPAFAHFLLNGWEVPEELQCDRFGVEAYQHPELVAALGATAPEETLLELIDAIIFGGYNAPVEWSGRSQELERQLRASHPHKAEIDRVLTHSNSCGAYLGRLERSHPARISRRMLDGNNIWMIRRDGPAKSFFKHRDPNAMEYIRERLEAARLKVRPDEATGTEG